jgi:hypothetical protein
MVKRTMQSLSYGLSTPNDLLEKMKYDGNKIGQDIHPYDVFNFILTSASLNEWILKYYENQMDPALREAIHSCKKLDGFPNETTMWIKDVSCVPNTGWDIRKQIQDCIQICHQVCNASKHFNWTTEKNKTKISSIEKKPVIKDYYQYFFTKVGPGVYIEYDGVHYCITQIRDILIQFYAGLLPFLENRRQVDIDS